MRLGICVATMQPRPETPAPTIDDTVPEIRFNYPGEISSWTTHAGVGVAVHTFYNTPEKNLGVVGSYDVLTKHSNEEVLAFLHDDVVCKEQDWDERVLGEFLDSKVGVVGFGGALRHGRENLYKVPYRLQDLARERYFSNVDDAEVHGGRFVGAMNVAVLDGFALIVRRELLERAGGWGKIAEGCDFFGYDYALCAWARRLGYKVRLVGIRCHHFGGRTSVGKGNPIVGQDAYDKSHRWFYDEFRDVMPYEVKQ